MADKKKRQTKCKSDDQKNTKGGASLAAVSSLPGRQTIYPSSNTLDPRRTGHLPSTRGSKSLSQRITRERSMQQHTAPRINSPYSNSPRSHPSDANSTQSRHLFSNTHNPQQKKTLQNGLNQLQEYFHVLILEKRLVRNNTFNEDGVEVLSTSYDGQQPPGGGNNVVILDYECFEEKSDGNPKKVFNDSCCKPPITPNCKNLVSLIKKLLKEILSEFFKSASSPEILKFDIAKVAKACVVSYFIETITAQLLDNKPNSNNSNSSNKKELVKFYIKVSVQAITGGKVNTARDFLVHVNVNSLKLLLEVPNINVLTSKIINNELKTQIPDIIKEIKNVINEVNTSVEPNNSTNY